MKKQMQQGFTLVELAIVMIIVGLLIGGILKGQELISNARVAATVSQVKAIDAAMNTFFEAYSALPGDITNPSTRIPNCTATPCSTTSSATVGNGNGRIWQEAAATDNPGAAATIGLENIVAWANMSAADVLGGVRPNATALNPGEAFPNAQVPGSSIVMGYSAGTLTVANVPSVRAGHYVLISNARSGTLAATVAGGMSMTPSIAFRIDQKMDDGRPNTGSVFGAGAATSSAAGCKADSTVSATYNEALPTTECAIYARVGG